MQSAAVRCLILIAVLAAGTWLLATATPPRVPAAARWPTDEKVYAAGGWTAGPPTVEHASGAYAVRRDFVDAAGTVAHLVVVTSTEAKSVYRVGAEVPFLGSGYTVDPAPPSLVPPAPGRRALLARREDDRWLILTAMGERRGLVGNGVYGWTLVALDAMAGRANDYVRLHLLIPFDRLDADQGRAVAALGDTLFARLASWYAA